MLTPTDKKINYLMYVTIAVITSAAVFMTFRYAFDMMLPVGLMN